MRMARALCILAIATGFGWGKPVALQGGSTVRVSVSSQGTQANGDSYAPGAGLSADGRFVVFESNATNLVAGDTNGKQDIFIYDRQTGGTDRLSISSTGQQGNGDSAWPAVSEDGRFVAFYSRATNLVANDTNGAEDVFVRDRANGQTIRVSLSFSGQQSNGNSFFPTISGNGRIVAYVSIATNLVAGDINGQSDIFVCELQTGATTRVNVSSSGQEANGDSNFYRPSLSRDGRYVAFNSLASNLVAGDTNGGWDIFVRDRQSGQTTLESRSSSGQQGSNWSQWPSISADGRYVAFKSFASNLVSGDSNGTWDVFVRDKQSGTIVRASVGSGGQQGNNPSQDPALSANGRFVAFTSQSTNLAADDSNGVADVFVRDLTSGTTSRSSLTENGGEANGPSDYFGPSLSSEGRSIAFASLASNLVSGDTNGVWDVFVHDQTPENSRIIYVDRDAPGPNHDGLSWTTAFMNVSDGLADADPGDEVWVADGTYLERITLVPAVGLYGGFRGSESSRDQRNWNANVTILDGQAAGSVVVVPAGAPMSTTIDGFTIRNGKAASGGGVYVVEASPMIANNRIVNNVSDGGEYSGGGGIYCLAGAPTIKSNTFAGNQSDWHGGGILCEYANAAILNNTFSANHGQWGGGIYIASSYSTVANNLIAGNSASTAGGGIYCDYASPSIVNNTILSNTASGGGGIRYYFSSAHTANNIIAYNSSGVSLNISGAPTFSCNDVFSNGGANYDGLADQSGLDGNISQDPRLVDRARANYHLRSDSPCRNAGDSSVVNSGWVDFDGKARIQESRVDIGFDEYGDGSFGGAIGSGGQLRQKVFARLSVMPLTTSDCELPVEVTYWNVDTNPVSGYSITLTFPAAYATFDGVAPGMPQPAEINQDAGYVRWTNLDALSGRPENTEVTDPRPIKAYLKVKAGVPFGTTIRPTVKITGPSVELFVVPSGSSTVTQIGPNDFDDELFFPEQGLISAGNWFGENDVTAAIYASVTTSIGSDSGLPSEKRLNVSVDPRMYGRIRGGQIQWFEDTGRYPLFATITLVNAAGREVSSRSVTTDVNFDEVYGDSSWVSLDAPDPGVYKLSVKMTLFKRAKINGGGGFGAGDLSQGSEVAYWIAVRRRQTSFPDTGVLEIICRDSLGQLASQPFEVRDEAGVLVGWGDTTVDEQSPAKLQLPSGIYSVKVWSPFDSSFKEGRAAVSPLDVRPTTYLAAFVAPYDPSPIWLKNDQRQGWTRNVNVPFGQQNGHLLLDNLSPYAGETLVVTITGPVGFKVVPSGSVDLSPENGMPLVYYVHQGELLEDVIGPLCAKIALNAVTTGIARAEMGWMVAGPAGAGAGLKEGILEGAAVGLVQGVFDGMSRSRDYTIATIVIPSAPAQSYLFEIQNPWGRVWSNNTVSVNPIMSGDVNRVLADSSIITQADLVFGNGLVEKEFQSGSEGKRTVQLAYLGPDGADLEVVIKGPNYMSVLDHPGMQIIDWKRNMSVQQFLGEFAMRAAVATTANLIGKFTGRLVSDGLNQYAGTLGNNIKGYADHLVSDWTKEQFKEAVRNDMITAEEAVVAPLLEQAIKDPVEREMFRRDRVLRKLDHSDTYGLFGDSLADTVLDLYDGQSANHDQFVLRIPSAKNGSLYTFTMKADLPLRRFYVQVSGRSYERN